MIVLLIAGFIYLALDWFEVFRMIIDFAFRIIRYAFLAGLMIGGAIYQMSNHLTDDVATKQVEQPKVGE